MSSITKLPYTDDIKRRMARAKVSLERLGRFYQIAADLLSAKILSGREIVDLLAEAIEVFLTENPTLPGYYRKHMRRSIPKWVKAIVKGLPHRDRFVADAKTAHKELV